MFEWLSRATLHLEYTSHIMVYMLYTAILLYQIFAGQNFVQSTYPKVTIGSMYM